MRSRRACSAIWVWSTRRSRRAAKLRRVTDPSSSADRDVLIERFVTACADDERIVAAFLGGSLAREDADAHSDVDLCVITRADAVADVVADRLSLIRRLGEPLFVEDWGLERVVSFVLADGTEAEIVFGREDALDELRPGPHRTLFDPSGILEGVAFDKERADPGDLEKALRQSLEWFWHELSHFVKAVGRGQLWWAAGQLEALRGHCVNLVRIEQGAEAGEEPYWKLDLEIDTTALEPLTGTFVPMEREAILEAGRVLVGFFQEHAPQVAEVRGLAYPSELDRIYVERLNAL